MMSIAIMDAPTKIQPLINKLDFLSNHLCVYWMPSFQTNGIHRSQIWDTLCQTCWNQIAVVNPTEISKRISSIRHLFLYPVALSMQAIPHALLHLELTYKTNFDLYFRTVQLSF